MELFEYALLTLVFVAALGARLFIKDEPPGAGTTGPDSTRTDKEQLK